MYKVNFFRTNVKERKQLKELMKQQKLLKQMIIDAKLKLPPNNTTVNNS